MAEHGALRCGFIGLGAMGAPMAGHLHARGLLTAVGNRTQAIDAVLQDPGSRTSDLGGPLGTQAYAARVAERLAHDAESAARAPNSSP